MVRNALKGKLMKRNNKKRVNPKYKDRVFKFIFGNPSNKEWTLALYNGVNGSNHKNPDDIRFNTIDEMPDDFVIREFLFANRAGVKAMFLTEYDEEREKELLRREERRETEKEINERVASDMLKDSAVPPMLAEAEDPAASVVTSPMSMSGVGPTGP